MRIEMRLRCFWSFISGNRQQEIGKGQLEIGNWLFDKMECLDFLDSLEVLSSLEALDILDLSVK